jgi:hypothetical protein
MSENLSRPSLRGLWRQGWAVSPALTLGTVAMFAGFVLSALGLGLDSRQLLGEPVWLKPAKFYLSLVLYDATLIYLLGFLSQQRRLVRLVGFILSACGVLEMVAITLQAARGVRSHFNVGAPFDAALYSAMGTVITVLWVTMGVLGVALLRAKLEDRPLASALRMGLAVAILGAGLGYAMTAPRPGQRALLAAHQNPLESGAHTFGATDGGPGLPLVGWSTTAGDMRPAHFVGLHGMQVLPFLALLLARRRGPSEARRLAWVRTAGVAYLGLTGALALQAFRGLPLLTWDAAGLTSLVLVLFASLATFAASLRGGGEYPLQVRPSQPS